MLLNKSSWEVRNEISDIDDRIDREHRSARCAAFGAQNELTRVLLHSPSKRPLMDLPGIEVMVGPLANRTLLSGRSKG